MSDERWCRECHNEPAGDDGFCSDYCAVKFDRAFEPVNPNEDGGEA